MQNLKVPDVVEINKDCPTPEMVFDRFGKAYIPFQNLCSIYNAADAFMRGTMFPELDLPYTPRRGVQHGK